MRARHWGAIAGVVALVGLVPCQALAQRGGAPDLSGLVGASQARGELALTNRGFLPAQIRGGATFWWHDGARLCVQVATQNSHIVSVTPVAAAYCGA